MIPLVLFLILLSCATMKLVSSFSPPRLGLDGAVNRATLRRLSRTSLLMEVENEAGYTRKQLLREETEAPFRKVREFLYISLLAAATLGLFISGSG